MLSRLALYNLLFFSFGLFFSPLLSQATDELNDDTVIINNNDLSDFDEEDDEYEYYDDDEEEYGDRYIDKIIITGNTRVSEEIIRHHIPYRIGDNFDPLKTGTLIRNLYALKQFSQIEVFGENVGQDHITIYVNVHEKKKLRDAKFTGNKHLIESAIRKKINLAKIPAVDEEELKKFAKTIKHMYEERGYHSALIEHHLEDVDDNKVDVFFDIDEGPYTVVKRVFFKGNEHINSKVLRKSIFTREDWLFSLVDRSGTYHPDAIEMDKQTIETIYQNQGFLAAKVTDITIDTDKDSGDFLILFQIEEGPQFTITEISVPGNEIMDEEEILRVLPIREGQRYSKSRIQSAIEGLRNLWGEHGYIYADVDPSVQPNEQDHSVKIALYSELGNKVRLNKINIIGNKKSRDKIIRRQLILDEGDILKNSKMEISKDRVGNLGYFDARDGVNWKINRINDELCDLDLILKEKRTGKFELEAGTNGNAFDIKNVTDAFNVKISRSDTNWRGLGLQHSLSGAISRQSYSGNFNVVQPYLFDKPISGMFSLGAGSQSIDDMKNLIHGNTVNENRIGGSTGIGFFLPSNINTMFQVGVDHLHYKDTFKNKPEPPQVGFSANELLEIQAILNRRFESGTSLWLANITSKDTRNHPLHASRGHQWSTSFKCGIPTKSLLTTGPTSYDGSKLEPGDNRNAIVGTNFGFARFEADASWYTPLIGEHDLIFCLHGHVGAVSRLGNHTIPHRELFHVGGPASVRGFQFGDISPRWRTSEENNSPIGATKAFWVNTELIMPLTPDFVYKAAVFYDGGAGWDAPDSDLVSSANLTNNGFNYRHSIGVGLRMLNPTNIQIDWAIKLDQNKKIGEPLSEIHFTANHSF